MAEETLTIAITDFNELIRLITEQNKRHDNNHAEFLEQIRSVNAEHEKRYNEFYRISQSILTEVKKSVKNHETRITDLERKIVKFEEFIKG